MKFALWFVCVLHVLLALGLMFESLVAAAILWGSGMILAAIAEILNHMERAEVRDKATHDAIQLIAYETSKAARQRDNYEQV